MIPKASEQKINKEALLRARAQRLEKLKAKRGEYDAEARKEGHDPLGIPPQILKLFQLPLLNPKIKDLFLLQTRRSSLRVKGRQKRPPKSLPPRNQGPLSLQNPPKSRAIKRTLARSPCLFLPTLLSEIRKGGTTSTRN